MALLARHSPEATSADVEAFPSTVGRQPAGVRGGPGDEGGKSGEAATGDELDFSEYLIGGG